MDALRSALGVADQPHACHRDLAGRTTGQLRTRTAATEGRTPSPLRPTTDTGGQDTSAAAGGTPVQPPLLRPTAAPYTFLGGVTTAAQQPVQTAEAAEQTRVALLERDRRQLQAYWDQERQKQSISTPNGYNFTSNRKIRLAQLEC